jgi:diguanylate cyclase (GGDEF)-like protein
MPYLYFQVIFTTLILIYTTRAATPLYITVVLPCPLLFAALYRLQYWRKARRYVEQRDIQTIRRDILGAKILGPSLALGFTLIGVLSISSGDLATKLLVLVVIWVASVSSAFCLFVLPRAAMLVVGASGLPLVLVFIRQGTEITTMLALVIFSVSCLINYVLHENFKNFTEIVYSRSTIAEKHRQAEIARDAATTMAFTDPLTELSNRRHFEAILYQRTHDESLKSIPFAVGMLDLDGFKPVNDVYGHAAGDSVLRQVAERLGAAMQGRGCLARMGGDEFAVIVENVATPDSAIASGREIMSCFSKPFSLGARSVNLKATCGFCLHSSSGDDPIRLVDRADMALYRFKAKERGGNCRIRRRRRDLGPEARKNRTCVAFGGRGRQD